MTLEDFGGGVNMDNTPALNAYRDYINTNGMTELTLGVGAYRFDSPPAIFYGAAPVIRGPSMASTSLVRNYSHQMFIQVIGATGWDFRRFQCRAGPGDGGILMYIAATSARGANNGIMEDLIFDSAGGFCNVALMINGFAKTTGAAGVRSTTLRNVQIFTNNPPLIIDRVAADIRGVAGLSWVGGGIVSGDLVIVGSSLFSPLYITMNLEQIGGNIALTNCNDISIKATTILSVGQGGDNNNCWIGGRVAGNVTNNWTNSGVVPS